ncbi:hypothetical protein M3Y97_01122600 [Aphelenchoides bicaudatus]|nr:hypothetical protein M3Y97_01122600 [Aphelenchoides bicaudatus]
MLFKFALLLLAIGYAEAGTSGSGQCADLALNCAENNNLCTNRIYEALMRQQCPLTCLICQPPANCRDTNQNCPVWKRNGFCESPFYDESVKKQYCQLSCNIDCGGSGASG